jgi:hypothetical protein
MPIVNHHFLNTHQAPDDQGLYFGKDVICHLPSMLGRQVHSQVSQQPLAAFVAVIVGRRLLNSNIRSVYVLRKSE